MNTSIFGELNWLAILCAALGYFFLGALWYSKALFAKQWLAFVKIDPNNEDAKKGMLRIMLSSFVLMFITALGIAILQHKMVLAGGWMSGAKLGLITGLCFGATAISISYLYEQRPAGLHFINGAYTVLGNIIAAIIICCWK